MFADSEAKNSRERVLQTLLANDRCTINELAEAVNINPISIRHHINKLEADGLVISEEERHGVGRPRRLYFLTEKGREQFPTRYIRLTVRLIEQLKEIMPQIALDQIFSQVAQSIASNYQAEADNLPMEERLKLVQGLLKNEGFNVELEQDGDFYHLREVSCPYFHVGQNHPEVCSVDQTLISTLLAIPAQKVRCMLHGDTSCTYIVPTSEILEKQEV